MRHHPHLYQLNACLFVRRISGKQGKALTLATLPDEEWGLVRRLGFDLVWLMGVWERSPGSRRQALLNASLRCEYDLVLPGWTDEDITGSPYAVHAYRLDPFLGKAADLTRLKSKLHEKGLGLVLDFVPNHLALDHPWVISHPDWFVPGNKAEALKYPDRFFSPDSRRYIAHGRDPNFPPWTDTAQVNFYSPGLRQALISELRQIAAVADGVRCDMAMLALNDVFEQVWGQLVEGPRPATEFWVEAIEQVKQRWPDFLFVAEAYWGLERKLQQMGFDFTYDKPFYDWLCYAVPREIKDYLTANDRYQEHCLRFIENHDEPRAVTAFGRDRSLAAAVVLATVPGLRLFHDGQLEGKAIRLPVQLAREPKEVADTDIMRFYHRLLSICNAPAFHEGEWRLLAASPGWEGNDSYQNLLAWYWQHTGFKIVIVNYSQNQAQGWLKLPLLPERERVVFRDELTGTKYIRDHGELRSRGLYIDLGPYRAHILDMALD